MTDFEFDKYADVQQAVQNSWSAPDKFTSSELQKVRERDMTPFASIFILDADKEYLTCQKEGIVATPFVQIYYKGEKMEIRRPDHSDSPSFVGCLNRDQAVTLLQSARTAISCQSSTVEISF